MAKRALTPCSPTLVKQPFTQQNQFQHKVGTLGQHEKKQKNPPNAEKRKRKRKKANAQP